MENSYFYTVILAGGEGTRFAPLSTKELPKQFLAITDPGKTMIQATYERLKSLTPDSQFFISTNSRYISLVRDQIPSVPVSQIIGEPVKKNTAPPVALLTRIAFEKNPEAVVAFFPADHFIADAKGAVSCIRKAVDLAKTERALVTFGVPPDFPSSDYGYIRQNGSNHESGAKWVHSFVEKPDRNTAAAYLKSGEYFWNSGIFVWKAAVFLEAVGRHAPWLSSLLEGISFNRDGTPDPVSCRHFFEQALSISVDYAVMEKAKNVMMLPFNVGWSDVGTWQGLKDLALRHQLTLPAGIRNHLSRI